MHIVCYAGGTCGDLITALIDHRDCTLEQGRVRVGADRSRLKKPHGFSNCQQKDAYVASMSGCYSSLPSHDLDYHVERRHDFIGITVCQPDLAKWAAARFQCMHPAHVWQEMMRHCGAESLDQYAQVLLDFGTVISQRTSKTIDLREILDGTVIHTLERLIDRPINDAFYHDWRQQQ
jgi:hypothetical protein